MFNQNVSKMYKEVEIKTSKIIIQKHFENNTIKRIFSN